MSNDITTHLSNNVVLEQAVKDFKRSVEITRDVRFQANLRLSKRERHSSYLVSILSLFVIGLSLVPNITLLNAQQSQILLACSIILSVFVIFTSLIDGAQNFYHQGELLHQCARKIATIHHELKNLDFSTDPKSASKKFFELQEQYAKALDECPVNHDNVDFEREQYYKPHHFRDNYSQNRHIKNSQIVYKKVKVWVMTYSWLFPHTFILMCVLMVVYFFIFKGM